MLVEFTLKNDYWGAFELNGEDLDFLNYHLLEIETPLSPENLVKHLISDRIRREKELAAIEAEKDGAIYLPKNSYAVGDNLVFPYFDNSKGVVTGVRPGEGAQGEKFEVLEVEFDNGDTKELAFKLNDHALNHPPELESEDPSIDPSSIMLEYGELLAKTLIDELKSNDDFVYIAGRWFPKSLIIDVNDGNLNLAEAVLDMHDGGPLSTVDLIDHVGLPENVNPHLAEFSLDLALQEDERFDEVGPEGEVAWFLKKNEPESVLNTPIYLKYEPIVFDRESLTEEMVTLEQFVDDELSPISSLDAEVDELEIRLIFPHWRAGTLPLSPRMSSLFPTAYESPRIRFMLVDGETGEKFPAWVVRLERYVYGLSDWYARKGLMPGSYIKVKHGENPGEVIVDSESHRSNKEWVRTALIGTDGGVVFAMLKQSVSAKFDERMMINIAGEILPLEERWKKKNKSAIDDVIVRNMRELAKLNPQNHVHLTELYSAVNMEMRTPPGPIMNFLVDKPWIKHVGDLHFRIEEQEK